MVYEYSIIWDGEEITINKNKMEEMWILVIGSYTFDMEDVYPEETGEGAYFGLKSPNLPNYARIIGDWVNYKIEGFSVTQFSVSKKPKKKKENRFYI